MNEVFLNAEREKYDSWGYSKYVCCTDITKSFERSKPDDDRFNELSECAKYADILWFPTGGGKQKLILINCVHYFMIV